MTVYGTSKRCKNTWEMASTSPSTTISKSSSRMCMALSVFRTSHHCKRYLRSQSSQFGQKVLSSSTQSLTRQTFYNWDSKATKISIKFSSAKQPQPRLIHGRQNKIHSCTNSTVSCSTYGKSKQRMSARLTVSLTGSAM